METIAVGPAAPPPADPHRPPRGYVADPLRDTGRSTPSAFNTLLLVVLSVSSWLAPVVGFLARECQMD